MVSCKGCKAATSCSTRTTGFVQGSTDACNNRTPAANIISAWPEYHYRPTNASNSDRWSAYIIGFRWSYSYHSATAHADKPTEPAAKHPNTWTPRTSCYPYPSPITNTAKHASPVTEPESITIKRGKHQSASSFNPRTPVSAQKAASRDGEPSPECRNGSRSFERLTAIGSSSC